MDKNYDVGKELIEMKENNKKENKYFAVYNETTANILKGVTGQRYYKFKNDKGENCYSFVNDEKLQMALKMLSILKKIDVSKLTIV